MYNQKRVEWNHKCEISLYDSPVYTSSDKPGTTGKCDKEDTVIPKEYLKQVRTPYEKMGLRDKEASDSRRKKYYTRKTYYMVDLAIQNGLDTFITLTFADDIKDYSTAKHCWELFLKRMRYCLEMEGTDIKYIAVHELQKNRGVFHFHVLTNIGYFPHEKLMKIWKNGFVDIRKIGREVGDKERVKLVAYISKYITKDIIEESRRGERNRRRKIYCSRNLEKPVVKKVFSTQNVEDVIFENMENIISESTYNMRDRYGDIINNVNVISVRKEENLY